MKLTKEQRKVAYATAADNLRPPLKYVQIKGGKAVALDGFVLAEVSLDTTEEENLLGFLIPGKDLLSAKDSKGGGVIITPPVEGKVKLIGEQTTEVVLFERTFPETEQLYPTLPEVFSIYLNTDKLEKLIKICGKDASVKFTFYRSSLPVKFETEKERIRGLVMPMASWGKREV